MKIKPKNHITYQNIYNCIYQNTKKVKIYNTIMSNLHPWKRDSSGDIRCFLCCPSKQAVADYLIRRDAHVTSRWYSRFFFKFGKNSLFLLGYIDTHTKSYPRFETQQRKKSILRQFYFTLNIQQAINTMQPFHDILPIYKTSIRQQDLKVWKINKLLRFMSKLLVASLIIETWPPEWYVL